MKTIASPFWKSRKLQWRGWFALAILLLLIHYSPIRFGLLRLLIVVLLVLWWIGLFVLVKQKKLARCGWFATSALFVLILLLPGSPADPFALRTQYVAALRGYNGTRYVWGGETHTGIDCSGLIRAAMIDALREQGMRNLNPSLLRASCALWWDDCSARALGEEYHERTRYLFSTRSLNSVDARLLSPGDFAVTQSGVHTLAYLGEGEWIEADPSALAGDRVIQVRTPSTNPWFSQPMKIMRWRNLSSS